MGAFDLTVRANLCIIYEVNSMQIKISALSKVGSMLTFEEVVPAESFPDLIQLGEFHSPLDIQVTVVKTESGFLVYGSASGDVTLRCSRCLESFVYHVEAEFDDEFVPQSSINSEPEFADLGDEVSTYQGDYIDIKELITESVLLDVPMKVVCREDCKGICPDCGQALNEKTCQCNPHKPDPRLAVLADLFKE